MREPTFSSVVKETMEGLNIILIVTDQHALHAVSCYEGRICRTPNIDSLAADGVRFTRAYTPCALCTPARASLLSGLYPHKHGAFYNSGCHLPFAEEHIGKGTEIYPHRLIERGYRLGYVGKWHAGLARVAADVGFEGFSLRGLAQSPVVGPKGNIEFLAWLAWPRDGEPVLVEKFVSPLFT